mmetsp:Transcript_17609/g.36114  ORF Transcript_17609/g.36114 Transcript_17609/m.36114 type:complete len:597 (+) Transcript_17609:186-1976(+)
MADGVHRSQCDDSSTKNAVAAFWLLGLLNNTPWVLMLACATNISSGGVALVFLANQIPGLVVKISAPYWFHNVSYKSRMLMASLAMGVACFLVGCGGLLRDEHANHALDNDENEDMDSASNNDVFVNDGHSESINNNAQILGLALELLGVCFVSFQCSLGEASLLALAGRFDSVVLTFAQSTNSYLVMSEDRINGEGDFSFENDDADKSCHGEVCNEENNSTTQQSMRVAAIMKKAGVKQKRRCITAFSSGTGLAGIFGYGYKAFFAEAFHWGLSYIVWSSMLFALLYWKIFIKGLHALEKKSTPTISRHNSNSDRFQSNNITRDTSGSPLLTNDNKSSTGRDLSINHDEHDRSTEEYGLNSIDNDGEQYDATLEMVGQYTSNQHSSGDNTSTSRAVSSLDSRKTESSLSEKGLSSLDRFKLVISLWPYTIPLFTVYLAEYMLQAGVWSAIGFPVTNPGARAQFYQYSNWTYQAGVFVSRSSGNIFIASLRVIWLMPFLQALNLFLFWSISMHHYWYNYSLLILCFFSGLLGGGVYVQGYSRINTDLPISLREFAISSASVADGLGILLADIFSLFIQSCIYEKNGVEGAVVSCPL